MSASGPVLDAILEQRVIGIVRLPSAEEAVVACELLAAAGLIAMEVSLAQPDAPAAISAASRSLGAGAFVGAGTVRTVADAAEAVAAGAQFLVGPGLDEDVASWATERELLYIPGALTPTEVEAASRCSELVKLFPAGRLGPDYLEDLRAPFPDVRFVATGAVGLDDVSGFLEAGAAAVALGSALVNAGTIRTRDTVAAATHRVLQLTTQATSTTKGS